LNIRLKDLIVNDSLIIRDTYGNRKAEVYIDNANIVTILDLDLGKSYAICKDHLEGLLYQLYRINLSETLKNSELEVFRKNGKKRI